MDLQFTIIVVAIVILTSGADAAQVSEEAHKTEHVVHGAETTTPGPGTCSVSPLISDERRLLDCLLTTYDPAVRPVNNVKDVVNVSMNFILLRIIEVHEKDQIIDLNVWMHKTWTDQQLVWNPADYGGIKKIRIPTSRIWIPDIILLNSADPSFKYVTDKLAVVQHDGMVIWVPNARLRSYCVFNLRMFPFDSQNCQLMFGSWTYDMSKLNVTTPRNTSHKHIYEGQEWEVTQYHVRRHVLTYDIDEYPVLTWTIGITRKGAFYSNIMVAPSVILAILLCFVFFLPPGSGERIHLSIGILICQTLLLLLIEAYVPTEIAELPVIAVHLLFQMVMTALSIIISIGILNFHHRGVRRSKVPTWLRQIFVSKLSRLFCLKAEAYTSIPSDISQIDSGVSEMRNVDELGLDSPTGGKTSMERTLEDIRYYLKVSASRATEPQPSFPSHRELVVGEWHQVALVVDRLMFLVFSVVTAVVTVSILSH